MSTWFMSFVGDEGCRGVCVVDADSPKLAVEKAARLGINPGGEVMLYRMDDCGMEEAAELGRDRLISVAELERRGYQKTSDLTLEELEELSVDPDIASMEQNS